MDYDPNISAMVTVLIAAGVTYSFRVGGLLLSDKLPQNGPFKRFMQALPGTILLSLVAPGIVAAGLWGGIAALATAICAFRTRNVFLSMLVGMVIIIVQRNFF